MNQMVQTASPAVGGPCPVCNYAWGPGPVCQTCKQVGGLPLGVQLSSPGRRLGAALLDGLLLVVTLFIGWLIWALIVFGRGQTPGKQILNMRTIHLPTASVASWGRMALRELPSKFLIGILASLTLLIVYFWLLWDKNNQELWDKMVDTVVVTDERGMLGQHAGPPGQHGQAQGYQGQFEKH